MNQSTLGSRIKFHRKRLGMTQEQLAARMSVSAQAVSKWENDLSCPDISVLPDLASVFGISVDELLGRDAPKETVHEAEVADAPQNKDARDRHLHFDIECGKWDGILFAVYILVVGGLLLVNGLLKSDVSWWRVVWTTGLIFFIGVNGLRRKFTLFSLAVTLTGLYFLLDAYSIWPQTWNLGWSVLLPLFLLLWGVSLLIDVFRRRHHCRHHFQAGKTPTCEYSCENGILKCDASFGERRIPVVTPLLRSGSIDTAFGDFTVDFSGCEAVAEGCTLTVDHSFGNLTLLIPDRFDVRFLNQDNTAGSVERNGNPSATPQGTILIELDNSFGNLSIHFI